MFGWEFPPNISGGLGTACYGIVNGLLSYQDVNVKFVVPKAYGNEKTNDIQLISAENISIGKNEFSEQAIGSFSMLEVPSNLTPYSNPEIFEEQGIILHQGQTKIPESKSDHLKFSFSGKYGQNLFEEINNYAVVAKSIAQQNQFHLIHAHDWLTFPAAIAAKKVSGKPLVVHVHSTDFDRSGGSVNPAIYAIEKQGMVEADRIITVSNRIKNRLIDDYGISPGKITTIYNAIDPSPQNLKPMKHRKQKTVTFLGRITVQKGPFYFAEVARTVLSRMKNVRFVMAGDGELRNEIIEYCARFGISDRFHFAGFLNRNEITEVLDQSDVFIMPSVSEPFGIVPLEAMQANVPAIISIQSGVSELIRCAVKTDFWDVGAMADAVHGILKYKKLSKALIKEGKNEVDRLDWKSSAREIRQVYLNTLSGLAS